MFGRRYELFERKNRTIPELLVEFFETVGETEELYKQSKIAETENMEEVILFQLK